MKEQKNNLHNIESKSGQTYPLEEPKKQNRIIWLFIFIVIAAVSIWAVTAQNKNFSASEFLFCVKKASPFWLCAAIISMLAFIFSEACSIAYICKSFGYKCKWKNGFFYSATDIYFSAITPSATGGQPACAYFMMKEGIPGMIVTAVLLINVMMYAISLIVLGIAIIIVRPGVFFYFGTLSRILIVVGCFIQMGLVLLFYLLLYKESFLHRICSGTLRLLGKVRLVRNVDAKMKKLETSMEEYQQYADMFKGRRRIFIKALLLNILQRAAQIAVTVFVFLAFGGGFGRALDIWAIQSFVVIGAGCIPIPGAMGVTDYLMIDGFGMIMAAQQAAHLELLSRTLSFYCCILICGFSVILKFYLMKRNTIK